MRKLAASIIAVAMSLTGTSDSEASIGDGDDDVKCVEYSPGVSDGGSRVLNLASRVCHTPIEAAWIAQVNHKPQLAVAVNHEREYVTVIELISSTGPDCVSIALPQLLGQALQSAKEHGALKVIIETDGLPREDARLLAEIQGWNFWRYHTHHGTPAVEVMTNLYLNRNAGTKTTEA